MGRYSGIYKVIRHDVLDSRWDVKKYMARHPVGSIVHHPAVKMWNKSGDVVIPYNGVDVVLEYQGDEE